ncbi:MAG: tRNA (adenosine(37)-N6)-threonylcarbamoyltransferase complex ATPase subunit type 1 TsaE [Desulfobacteraceae bacterium]|nr:tRNA (adenosine(37)-N6)-threonylcarbamoyltransferase complex ATPase subunit type 1 TsaE [Desulfobacteraceae bacterium]
MTADPCCDLCVKTKSAEETFRLGRTLGKNINGPCMIALYGGLGAGKTVFIQGLARGLGVPEQYPVTSPSYTIINQYPGRLTLYHVDLYRIEDPEEIEQTGLHEILTKGEVSAVEWAEHLPDKVPKPDITIRIETQDSDTRRFSLFFYGPQARNLVETLKKFR